MTKEELEKENKRLYKMLNFACAFESPRGDGKPMLRLQWITYYIQKTCQEFGEQLKGILKEHCEYSNDNGWFLPENKINLLVNKFVEDNKVFDAIFNEENGE